MAEAVVNKRESRALARAQAALRDHIACRHAPGDRLPPVRDLARRLDCGETNLLRAVQRLVEQGLLTSRPGIGTFVTAAAGGPAGGHDQPGPLASRTIDICTAAAPDAAITQMVELVAGEISDAGGRVRFTRLDDRHGQETQPPCIDGSTADAVVVIDLYRDWPLRISSDQPLVVISDRPVSVDRSSRFDGVTVDAEQGGRLAGQFARAMGYRPACFIGANPHARISEKRYDPLAQHCLTGFELGFGEVLPPAHRIHRQINIPEAGAAAAADYLRMESRPQVVFASCDELAVGFIHGLRAHHLLAGRDLQVIGFGGLERGRSLAGASLTTVVPRRVEMAHEGVRLLADRLADPDRPPRRLALGCSFFEGETCRKPGRRK